MHAQSAYGRGFGDIARDSLASAETWKVEHDHLAENLAELEVQQATLEVQTSDEYLAEQKRLRGLD